MRIRLLAFARARELLGDAHDLELGDAALVRDIWPELTRRAPALDALAGSMRVARNGRIAAADEPLAEGDEVALLPPPGGG